MIVTQGSCVLVSLALSASVVRAGTVPDVAQRDIGQTLGETGIVQATVSPLPCPPRVRLAPIQGFDETGAYVRSVAGRASELAAVANGADKPTERVDYLLAAANLVLAHQLEPACTSMFLQISGEENVWDEAELRSALDRVNALLASADTTLQELRERDEQRSDPAELPDIACWLEERLSRLETLQAFAIGLRAYLMPGEGAEAARQVRRAASRLSPLLEDQRRPVAEAAALWQACLRSRESDPTRALSVLALALAKPPEEFMPYAFFARLQRSRIIAERGGHAAALALLLMIEERCNDWLTSDAERADGVRAAQLVRIQILADWYDAQASGSNHDTQRQWCVDRTKALIKEGFGDDSDTVLRLTPAIPIVARAPDLDAQPPKTTPEGD